MPPFLHLEVHMDEQQTSDNQHVLTEEDLRELAFESFGLTMAEGPEQAISIAQTIESLTKSVLMHGEGRPATREMALVLTKLQEAEMWANVHITQSEMK